MTTTAGVSSRWLRLDDSKDEDSVMDASKESVSSSLDYLSASLVFLAFCLVLGFLFEMNVPVRF